MKADLRSMPGPCQCLFEAEDAAQDVWLAVFRAVTRLADVGAFRAWLYRIARDRAARQLRGPRLPSQHFDELDPADEQAEEASFGEEDVEQVHAALDALSPEHREALVLRYIEDMAYEEIARVVGCQVGTVRSRLHYATHQPPPKRTTLPLPAQNRKRRRFIHTSLRLILVCF
jgi:RNA polymerase sigma-70 factor (ECF subfamily)